MSKPMLVTLPCVFLLLDYWPLGRVRFGARGPGAAAAQVAGRLLLEKLPFFALAAVWSALTWNFQQSAMQGGAEIPLAARAANAVVSYIRYLGKACWPTDLALLYPHPNLPGGTPWSSGQIAGSALLLVLLSAVAVSMTRRRYAAVGWLWFVGMLIPVIGLVQVGHQAMADRYTYLPAIGLFVAVVWAAGDATTSLARRDPRWTGVVGLLAVAVLLSFGLAARAQVNLWQNSLTLFEHSLRLHPDQPELHNNLAVELRARGRLDEAIEHYRRAVGIRPDYEAAQFNLANALLAAGRPEEAVAHYRLAGGIARRARDGCLRRAEQYLHRGWAEGALAELSRALQIDPDSGPGHHLLGHALRLAGDVPGATRAYERAVELIPDEAVPQQSLGDALWLTGRREEAIVHYRRGLELAPDSERARERLERALEEEDTAAP